MKIRHGVFETNSSSSHSIAIDDSADLLDMPFTQEDTDRGFVEIECGEFGWEQNTYSCVYSKLSYLVTSIASSLPYDENYTVEDIYDMEGFKTINDAVKEHSGLTVRIISSSGWRGFGYIDHQSSDVPREALVNKETIKRFLFSPKSFFETDNDNH